ncbi:DNA-binding response regulator [Helicobacter monodelphidis]|uniref:response regulator transcription factor n=1 Tax=Helicobacter sp. 15-1451 TaxID=2004995 RepID=UPI000DCF09E4|nr:response regulator transcription factor [Helicobacter sp. 15-1451]RAX56943.1 DNA-binding response regulator [Helicobacter sp. 15-1451]
MIKLLLVEDDITTQELISTYLQGFDIQTKAVASPLHTLNILRQNPQAFDILVLDLMLPEMDGLDLCREIRKICNTPIIISSARGDLGNKILGFELGADDYLAKPYEPRELVLRIHALLKRNRTESNILEIGELSIHEDKQEVFLNGKLLNLTPTEFSILMLFIRKRGEPVSRETLINEIENIHENNYSRSIDTHISNLRNKLGDNVKTPKYIKSVWGIGYKFIA